MTHTKLNRQKLLNLLAFFLLILAAVLFCVALLFQDPTFLAHYDDIMGRLAEFEYKVATIPYKGIVILVILLIYLSKAFLPLPISAICVIAGMAFQTPYAISIKYFWGKHLGGGIVHKFLVKNEGVRRVMNADMKANTVLLLAFRLVPSFPINTISQVYGAMQFDFKKYLLLSVLGFLPKLISYSFIGRNVYDPFSMAFILPIVILLLLSGLSVFGINAMIEFYSEKSKSKDSDKK